MDYRFRIIKYYKKNSDRKLQECFYAVVDSIY